MTKINCKLFGTISIKEDNEEIFIPSGKISGLFYYVLLKKVVSRDELANLFWPYSNEERAKTSLRNALHKLRKCFKDEIILSPNKSTLMLNEDLVYDIDVEQFSMDPENNLDIYTGEFLNGFYINDVVDFDYWIMENRTRCEELFVNCAEKKIVEGFDNNNLEKMKSYINDLLSIDNYNEVAYKYLLKFYNVQKRYDRVINEYHNLKNILYKELGISPSEDIKEIYADSLQKIKNKKPKNESKINEMFFGREYEMEIMDKCLNDFINSEKNKSILVMGESGIGKTELTNRVVSKYKKDCRVYAAKCFGVEKDYSYSIWIKLIREIDKELEKRNIDKPNIWNEMKKNIFFEGKDANLSFGNIAENKENLKENLIYNSLLIALEELSVDKKILIVIEDLQFADTLSVKLLINLIIQSNKIMFLVTSSDEMQKGTYRLVSSLKTLNKIETINLERFNKSEVSLILRQAFKEGSIDNQVINNIYDKCQGNTFLLFEYVDLYKNNKSLKNISTKMHSLFQEKFANLEKVDLKLLQVLSACYKQADINILLKITQMKAFDVMDSISDLVRSDIIRENEAEDSIEIEFVNEAYKEYIYSTIPESAKCALHGEIAEILENCLSSMDNDITMYIKLRNHYEKANNAVKSLYYDVYILNYYLNFNHELFPNLDDYDVNRQVKLHIKNDRALNLINETENKILKLKNINKNRLDDIRQSERLFLLIKGRYLIRCGSYTDGVNVLNIAIKMAQAEKDYATQLQGHKQMGIYGIQINDPDIMETHIMEGIKVANKLNSKNDMGVLYRLYGVNNLMRGKFDTALELFEKSISLLSSNNTLENPNSISVAANYNYIGEITNTKEDFVGAMKYFHMAISLCAHTEASCLSIFYINAGKTSFLMNNIQDMKKYLMLSKEIINDFDLYWKRSMLGALFSLLKFLEGDYKESLELLKETVSEVKTINNPRDVGMVYFVQTIIKSKIQGNNDINDLALKDILDEPLDYYFYKAINYLDPSRDIAEINYLKYNINSR